MTMQVSGKKGVPVTPGGPRQQGLVVQAVMIDGRPTRLVPEGDIDSIKLKFPNPDREVEIVVWTQEGRKVLAFK